VFTGSSRDGLATMFAARQAPFFHFATPIELPSLGEPFAEHILATMAKVAGRHPERRPMLAAFNAVHGNPYYFRMVVEAMLLNPDLATGDALADVRDRIATELGYPQTWYSLTPLQRAVAQTLLEHAKPFSHTSRSAMADKLGDRAPSPSRVQAALRRLERLGLVERRNGGWGPADPEWADWLRRTDA